MAEAGTESPQHQTKKARIDCIGEMQNREFKESLGKVDISTAGRRIGKKVIELENVSKRYDARALFKDFTYEFAPRRSGRHYRSQRRRQVHVDGHHHRADWSRIPAR